MIVEDNPGDARLLEITLNEVAGQHARSIHFNVRWVNLVETAVQYAGMQNPDIIFLDLSLPDSDGLNSIDTLVAAARHVPVIVLSGSMDDSLYDDVLDHGAQGYLIKHDLSPERLSLLLKSTVIGF